MQHAKKDIIDRLRLEAEVIEKGGYSPSVREPRKDLRLFRDSVSCLNMALEEKLEPCSHCFLMEFVPPEYRNEEEPCHFIPLNDRGDTIASLEAEGKHEQAETELLAWLKKTIAQLEQEAARGQAACWQAPLRRRK